MHILSLLNNKTHTDKPLDKKVYFRSLISYLLKLRSKGQLNDEQLNYLLTKVCSDYIDSMVTSKIEDKMIRSFMKASKVAEAI